MPDTLREMMEKALRPRMIITETLETWTSLSSFERESAAVDILESLSDEGYEVVESKKVVAEKV